MTKIVLLLTPLLTVVCSLFAMPAYAARDRVFVASYGSDSNPCTFGSPCKTFQQAITTVAAGGEVTAIDSAGFGPVNISNMSVTITSPAGIEAGIVATGTAAITIDAGSNNVVVLRGLTLDGAGSTNTGIHAISGARIEIIDCTVRNFNGYGIYILSPAQMSVVISNTLVSDILGLGYSPGIYLLSNGGPMIAALDQVTVVNSDIGVSAFANSEPLEAIISNSHIDNNGNTGLVVSGSALDTIGNVTLRNVTLNQTPYGIGLEGNSSIWFSQVTLTAVPGFTNNGGVSFTNGTNAAYSDGTSHLGSIVGDGSIGSWALQ